MKIETESFTANDPNHQMQADQQVTLKRDGKELLLMVGIKNTGKKIPANGGMVFEGTPGADSVLTIENAGFLPHIITQTTTPLKVEGSFVAAQGSTQIVLVDITPVALTDMKGVSRSAKEYKISTSDTHLREPGYDKRFPQGTKIFTYEGTDGKERTIYVEPGARVDFVNGLNGNTPLFTLDGSEPMETTRKRFTDARYNAMGTVSDVLESGLNGDDFAYAKQWAGLPANLTAGSVEHVNAGIVDMDTPAVADVSSYTGTEAVPVGRTASGADKDLRDEIARVSGFYLGKASPIFAGNYKFLGEGENNKGVLLGKALQEAKATADELINPQNDGVRTQMLGKLHVQMDKVEQISGDISEQLKDHFVGHGNDKVKTNENYVASYAHMINDNFTAFHTRLNASEALRDNRKGKSPAKDKKHGFVPSSEGEQYADVPQEERLLARLAKLAMAEGGEHDRLNVADVDSHEEGAPSVPKIISGSPTKTNRAA